MSGKHSVKVCRSKKLPSVPCNERDLILGMGVDAGRRSMIQYTSDYNDLVCRTGRERRDIVVLRRVVNPWGLAPKRTFGWRKAKRQKINTWYRI